LGEAHGAIEDPITRVQGANVDEGLSATGCQEQQAQMGHAIMEDQRARTVHQLKTAAAEDKQRCS
jgi:predicted carbohydrate-binding protein with CBM5 and CBM33 domain